MKDKKKIVIGTLCALIMIMAVGYALLSQQLSINGSASITSNWQVEITNITEKEKSTGATTNNTNYTATTASFNTSLTSPGDYALYEVTVTNKGTLDAVLSAEPTVTTGNNTAIQYELEGIKRGDKILKNNQTDTFTIKVQYNPATTTQPTTLTSNIEVTLNYEQDLGQVSPYDYSIGDKVTFSGSDWYVIKNSTSEEDYVTLLKEKVLSYSELGNNGVSHVCRGYEVNREYDCTEGNEIKKYDTMPFYWSDTCHGIYTINEQTYYVESESGCVGHNDYAGSKVKEVLENSYIKSLDETKLKEIDGYKIRLITKEELINNLGYFEKEVCTGGCYTALSNENVQTWVYKNFGETQNYTNGVYGYWTMTAEPGGSISGSHEWKIDSNGTLYHSIVYSDYDKGGFGVRPVINLLKSSIE